jgi:hypothetical protein
VRTDQCGLLADVSSVGRNYRQPTRIAGGHLILQAIVETVSWANGAAFEQSFESFHALR